MTYEEACTCAESKPRTVTKARPDTTGNRPTMEDRFGRGYTITQMGMVRTESRFDQAAATAFARGKAGRDGGSGKEGREASKPSPSYGKNTCKCGHAGANG